MQNLSVSSEEHGNIPSQSSLGNGHHLRENGERILLSGRDNGLVFKICHRLENIVKFRD